MAITEVIAGNTMLTENYLISPEDLLDQTLIKQIENYGKKGWVPSPSCLRETHRRGRRRWALDVAAAERGAEVAALPRRRRRLGTRRSHPIEIGLIKIERE